MNNNKIVRLNNTNHLVLKGLQYLPGHAYGKKSSVKWRGFLNLFFVVGFVIACSNSSSGPEEEEMILNLETFEVVTPKGVVQADIIPNVYVGPLNDHWFISITLEDEFVEGNAQNIQVYLCSSDFEGKLLAGEIDAAGSASLDSSLYPEQDVSVELVVTEAHVDGSVSMKGEDPLTFTAVESSGVAGDAGLYMASLEEDNLYFAGYWIVLEDMRQRGAWLPCPPYPFEFCRPQY